MAVGIGRRRGIIRSRHGGPCVRPVEWPRQVRQGQGQVGSGQVRRVSPGCARGAPLGGRPCAGSLFTASGPAATSIQRRFRAPGAPVRGKRGRRRRRAAGSSLGNPDRPHWCTACTKRAESRAAGRRGTITSSPEPGSGPAGARRARSGPNRGLRGGAEQSPHRRNPDQAPLVHGVHEAGRIAGCGEARNNHLIAGTRIRPHWCTACTKRAEIAGCGEARKQSPHRRNPDQAPLVHGVHEAGRVARCLARAQARAGASPALRGPDRASRCHAGQMAFPAGRSQVAKGLRQNTPLRERHAVRIGRDDLDADMVGARSEVLRDAGTDRLGAAPCHDCVDESIAPATVDIVRAEIPSAAGCSRSWAHPGRRPCAGVRWPAPVRRPAPGRPPPPAPAAGPGRGSPGRSSCAPR